MKAFGVTEIDESEEAEEEPFEVFEENEEALNVFVSMTTQWIVGGMGSALGLNYASLEVVMNILGVKEKAGCFFKIRIMELEALKLIREEEEQNRERSAVKV